ncbi:alpha/beta fold hydrolase [Pseudonocardia sp. GCM10023141]|uniref:alpha/beta fold hydrolase n=1 Tax=Pseudonocardia sp. GCM10023141 TaxID=3252653 RepID=UPI00361487E4
MPRAHSNGLELEYDTFGDAADPTLLLVMGLGAQMITWPVGFCELLAAQGYHAVRYDNRDIGLSTHLDDLGLPDTAAIMGGDTSTAPYLLADLADDAAGLLDTLGVAKAHVVGASMGGMIAQQFAIDHPDRLLSLCSIMSTTGDRSVGASSPAAMAALTRPPGTTREEIIEGGLVAQRVIGSPGYPPSDEYLRERGAESYDRSFHPAGFARQFAAILASPDRTEGLHGVTAATLVVHGEADPLVHVSGGRATAAAIPGAELLVLPGMGHDLPTELWTTIVEAIAKNAKG